MGVPPINRVGRIQRRIARALIASDGPLLTVDLLEAAYPRVTPPYEHWRYKTIYKSAEKFAVNVAGPRRAFIIWGPNRELAERLAEDASAEHD